VLVLGLAFPVLADDAEQPTPVSSIRDAAWFRRADRDGDGRLSREEAPKRAVFSEVDTDGDAFASVEELEAWLAKRPRGDARQLRPPSTVGRQDGAAPAAAADRFEKRAVTIWSDGTRMAGDLYLPSDIEPGGKRPAIVFCAGTGGTKGGTGGRLGPIFASHGYVALSFDYRGWGESESQLMTVGAQPKPDENGEMTVRVKALRWQMNYTDQTEDIRAAISFLAGEPAVDASRIGIMGSSYGGGLVTWVAGNDPRVKCVVAQVPGLGPPPSPARIDRIHRLHSRQARGETEPVPIETGKLGGKMARFEDMRINPAKNIGFSAVEAAGRIQVPVLFVVAENEELGDNDNARRVHEGIQGRGVPSGFHVVKGITHFGIYREGFEEATNVELAWFDMHLKGSSDGRSSTAADPNE
jgi:hypothetical protein